MEAKALRLIQADSRILSVTVVAGGRLARVKRSAKPEAETQEAVLINDVLQGISCAITPGSSLCQVVFALKDEEFIAEVEPGSDLIEIGHNIAEQLATVTTNNWQFLSP